MATSPTPSLDSLPGATNSIGSFGEHNEYLSDSPLTLSGSSPPVSDSAIGDDYSSCGLDSQIGSASGSSSSSGVCSLGGPRCTGCKGKQSDAVAKCIECANYLCANCVTAHQFMHCFEGHSVLRINELTNVAVGAAATAAATAPAVAANAANDDEPTSDGNGVGCIGVNGGDLTGPGESSECTGPSMASAMMSASSAAVTAPPMMLPPMAAASGAQSHLSKLMSGFDSHRLALNLKDEAFKCSLMGGGALSPPSSIAGSVSSSCHNNNGGGDNDMQSSTLISDFLMASRCYDGQPGPHPASAAAVAAAAAASSSLALLTSNKLNGYFCMRHRGELLKFYCRTCVMAICKECVTHDHPPPMHECEHVSDATPKQLDQLMKFVVDVRGKSVDMRSVLKQSEHNMSRISLQYNKATTEINDTYQFYLSMIEERKHELLKELENFNNAKNMQQQMMLSRAQENLDRVMQSCAFVDKLSKHAGLTETLMLRKLVENKMQCYLNSVQELQAPLELEFQSNFQAIQVGVRNTFGYIRSSPDMPTKQPPIARPTSASMHSHPGVIGSGANDSDENNGMQQHQMQQNQHQSMHPEQQQQQQQQQPQHHHNQQQQQQHHQNSYYHQLQQHHQNHQQLVDQMSIASMNQLNQTMSSTVSSLSAATNQSSSGGGGGGIIGGSGILERPYSNGSMCGGGNGNPGIIGSGLSSMSAQIQQSLAVGSSIGSAYDSASMNSGGSGGSTSLLQKRYNNGGGGVSSLSPFVGMGIGGNGRDMGGNSIGNNDNAMTLSMGSPYEKWSNGGSDSIFNNMNDNYGSIGSGGGIGNSMSLLTHANVNDASSPTGGMSSVSQVDTISALSAKLCAAPIFPPKSQIKRHKMIYHCKFGEFGVMEGQFTEPSGVAVNAQNDIIVADTNNHRIQIFDKEGRFKFQFGECGKRDGQLLYPNRVAVVRNSGDIIVTERSPTHQIQIYNQYGQFVRKFGANILQHPRGVTVDNKGRVIVVECKVMRVIIFDQSGNVLQKFGCSKHLEFPNGVVVNDKQEIFISDNRAHCVKVFSYEGVYLRQIGGEGITNYPIGVGINASGEILIADNHNNFNLTIFTQDGQLVSALESKVKHAQCFDVALMDDGSVVLASKDYRLYIYRYVQVPAIGM